MGRDFELLNVDDHLHILQRNRRDLSQARPDVTHQVRRTFTTTHPSFIYLLLSIFIFCFAKKCLLNLLDSPINKAGKLQVFVHTQKNVLIEINPHTRLPRTFKRFAGLMVQVSVLVVPFTPLTSLTPLQLLQKLRIRSADGNDVLLRVIKNPIEDYLPVGARRVATSSGADKTVHLDDFVPQLSPNNEPVVFVIGSFAKGDVEAAYADDRISFSNYPLSAALACAKTCTAFEKHWGIL